jgi:LysM repeat protein
MRILQKITFTLLGCTLIGSTALFAQKIGVETKNGKKYIIHQVQPKETVYSISKLYDVTTTELITLNPGIDKVLKYETKIHVPFDEDNVSNPKLQTGNVTESSTKHTVEKGEWLTKIAQKYEVSVADLKKWNDLKEEKVVPGQELIVGVSTSNTSKKNNNNPNTNNPTNKTNNKAVAMNLKAATSPDGKVAVTHTVAKGESIAALKKKYNVSMAQIKEWNNLKDENLKIDQVVTIYVPADQATNNNQVAVNTSNNLKENNSTVNKTTTGGGDPFNPNKTTTGGGDPFNPNKTTTGGGDPFNPNKNLQTANTVNTTKQPNDYYYDVEPNTVYSTPIKYVIKEGDYLKLLQDRYNIRKSEITFWNKLDPDPTHADKQLMVGKTIDIYIPAHLKHTIQAGESINSIAMKYKVFTKQIQIWNHLKQKQEALVITDKSPIYTSENLTGTANPLKPGAVLDIYQCTGPRPPHNYKDNAHATTTTQKSVTTTTTTYQNPKTTTTYQNPNTTTTYQNPNTTTTYQNPNTTTTYQNPNTSNVVTQGQVVSHTVAYNETILDVAQKYNVAPQDIMQWNNLNSSILVAGQPLKIFQPVGTVRGNVTTQNTTTQTGTTNNNTYTNPYQTQAYPGTTGGNPYGTQTGTPTNPYTNQNNNTNTTATTKNNSISSVYQTSNVTTQTGSTAHVQTKGFAKVNANMMSEKIYAAMHATAPIGTIIIIKNLSNSSQATCEVAAPLYSNDPNVIIELTPKVYEQLGAIGQNLLEVEISYYINK